MSGSVRDRYFDSELVCGSFTCTSRHSHHPLKDPCISAGSGAASSLRALCSMIHLQDVSRTVSGGDNEVPDAQLGFILSKLGYLQCGYLQLRQSLQNPFPVNKKWKLPGSHPKRTETNWMRQTWCQVRATPAKILVL